ncbi:unnamed protein product [Trifolium pratense]|uniref:Uncharacterized protein n=1 Tax=Trifolium pratense TaxID=57577 RepID=A0ACB0LLG2_TRIPR|nr:unnamed protein product [Trifolium pratense]
MQQIQRFLPTEYNLQPSISSKDILKVHPQQNLLEEHHLISKDQPSAKVAEQDYLIPSGISRSPYLQSSQSRVSNCKTLKAEYPFAKLSKRSTKVEKLSKRSIHLQSFQSGVSRVQNFQSKVENKG